MELMYLVPTTTLWDKFQYSKFIDEKTEAETIKIISLQSHGY